MKKSIVLLWIVFIISPHNLYSQGSSIRNIQERYARSAQTDKIMGKAIWITDSLLQIYKTTFPEAEVFSGSDSLWVFRLFINTHSPSVNFTKYAFDKVPYIVVNSDKRVNVSQWVQGESGMPSHHINGYLLFKKHDVDVTDLSLVLPDMFDGKLVFEWGEKDKN